MTKKEDYTRQGMFKITLKLHQRSPIILVVESEEDIYEAIKNNLHPVYKPSDRQFNMFLFSLIIERIDPDKTKEQIIKLLIDHNLLMIEEIDYEKY